MAKITTTLYGALALIPFQAQAPVREAWGYLTDVISAKDGTEQPIQLRSIARKTLAYSVPLQALDDPHIFNQVYGGIRALWAIPMWTDGQYLGTVAAGLTTINCDTVLHDLRANSLAILWTNPSTYRILEISSITTTSITFPTATAAMAGVYLLPLRVGYIDGAVERPTTGYGSAVKIRFFIDDAAERTVGAPTQYLSNDIYYVPPLMDEGKIDTNLEKDYDLIDFDLGRTARRTNWTYSRFGSTCRVLNEGFTEQKDYKDFLARRAGRYRKFWQPTFENNMRIKNTGTIVSTLVVWRDSYDDYATQRTHIAIEAGGVWYARAIGAPTVSDATTLQFTLSSALNIPADTVKRVCYLGLYRLDADMIEMSYIGNNVMSSQVQVVELTP